MTVMYTDGSYASEIGAQLAAARREGLDFEQAWEQATYRTARPEDWEPVTVRFLKRHMRAGFLRDVSQDGRLRVPRTDTTAVRFRVPLPSVNPSADRSRCRSGDGCDHVATRGRFGVKWCDHHADELERLWVVQGEGQRPVTDERKVA